MRDDATPDGPAATADSDAGDGESPEEPWNAWTRWDRRGEGKSVDHGTVPLEDLHLHQYCDVGPLTSNHEDALERTADGVRGKYVWFLSDGVLRAGLRQTPVVILATMLVLVVSAELSPAVGGVSVYLPAVGPVVVVVAAVLAGINLVLGWLLVEVDVLDSGDVIKAVVVYGVLLALVVGTAASVYLVLTSEDPTALEPNVVYTSGYLLMLFLGGLLVYDGMLRTEHLFVHLPDTLIVEEESDESETWDRDDDPCPNGSNNRAYHAFITDLKGRLQHEVTRFGVPTAYVFAVLFVAQFAGLWYVGVGPQNLDYPVTLAVNAFLDLFIVVVAFQFLVLVDALYNLVEGTYDVRSVEETIDGSDRDDSPGNRDSPNTGDESRIRALTYRPFHADGHGGFRDIGKFATRVNLLLIMAGLYTVYRLYVQGLRVAPAETVSALPLEIGATVWFVSYVVPILAYGVAAAAWLYYSFWHLHLRMAQERERQYIERQQEVVTGADGRRMGDLEEATEWLEKRNGAPTWPIDNRQLTSMVSGTLVPLLLSVPNLLL